MKNKIKADEVLLTVYDKKKIMGHYQYDTLNKIFIFTFDTSYQKGRNKKVEEIEAAAKKVGIRLEVRHG